MEYQIYNFREKIALARFFKTFKACQRACDKLDLIYGAYSYCPIKSNTK
jgi:hypothetical protein